MASVRSKETMVAAERIGDEGDRFTFRAPSAAASPTERLTFIKPNTKKPLFLVFSIPNGIPSKNQNRF
ncbi:hypothetical protein D3C84_1243580 [compost metagenome]|jgi:hypothetical protein